MNFKQDQNNIRPNSQSSPQHLPSAPMKDLNQEQVSKQNNTLSTTNIQVSKHTISPSKSLK